MVVPGDPFQKSKNEFNFLEHDVSKTKLFKLKDYESPWSSQLLPKYYLSLEKYHHS